MTHIITMKFSTATKPNSASALRRKSTNFTKTGISLRLILVAALLFQCATAASDGPPPPPPDGHRGMFRIQRDSLNLPGQPMQDCPECQGARTVMSKVIPTLRFLPRQRIQCPVCKGIGQVEVSPAASLDSADFGTNTPSDSGDDRPTVPAMLVRGFGGARRQTEGDLRAQIKQAGLERNFALVRELGQRLTALRTSSPIVLEPSRPKPTRRMGVSLPTLPGSDRRAAPQQPEEQKSHEPHPVEEQKMGAPSSPQQGQFGAAEPELHDKSHLPKMTGRPLAELLERQFGRFALRMFNNDEKTNADGSPLGAHENQPADDTIVWYWYHTKKKQYRFYKPFTQATIESRYTDPERTQAGSPVYYQTATSATKYKKYDWVPFKSGEHVFGHVGTVTSNKNPKGYKQYRRRYANLRPVLKLQYILTVIFDAAVFQDLERSMKDAPTHPVRYHRINDLDEPWQAKALVAGEKCNAVRSSRNPNGRAFPAVVVEISPVRANNASFKVRWEGLPDGWREQVENYTDYYGEPASRTVYADPHGNSQRRKPDSEERWLPASALRQPNDYSTHRSIQEPRPRSMYEGFKKAYGISEKLLEKQQLLEKWETYDHGSGGWLSDRANNPHQAVWCWMKPGETMHGWSYDEKKLVYGVKVPDRYRFYSADIQQSLERAYSRGFDGQNFMQNTSKGEKTCYMKICPKETYDVGDVVTITKNAERRDVDHRKAAIISHDNHERYLVEYYDTGREETVELFQLKGKLKLNTWGHVGFQKDQSKPHKDGYQIHRFEWSNSSTLTKDMKLACLETIRYGDLMAMTKDQTWIELKAKVWFQTADQASGLTAEEWNVLDRQLATQSGRELGGNKTIINLRLCDLSAEDRQATEAAMRAARATGQDTNDEKRPNSGDAEESSEDLPFVCGVCFCDYAEEDITRLPCNHFLCQ